nr:CPPV170 hypothetical protein [Cooks petrelpox virus]
MVLILLSYITISKLLKNIILLVICIRIPVFTM